VTAAHRRNEHTRQAILKAALEICQEQGYAKLTIEGVAARAGVGKQTIYRWWPSKGAVVLDAFLDELGTAIDVPIGGKLGGLPTSLRQTAALLSHSRYGSMLADLVGAIQHDGVLAREFRDRVYEPVRTQTLARIKHAQDAGEISADVDTGLVADLLFGPLWFRAIVLRNPPTPTYADTVIEAVLHGLRPGDRDAEPQAAPKRRR
jgi:AcrR family transcriptional regulator